MRIGLNCKFMYPGLCGGIEFYMRNLLMHLPIVDGTNDYVVFRNQYTEEEFREYSRPNLRIDVLEDPYTPSTYAAPRSLRLLIRVIRVIRRKIYNFDEINRRTVMNSGVELVHCLAGYLDYPTEILPNIVTIMDLQHEYFPVFFSEEQLRHRHHLWPRAAKTSQAIIAISNYTKKTILEKYGVSPDKIHVIHLAANPIYFEPLEMGRLREVSNKYKLPDRFVFYPAFTWPHKNHMTLIEALSIYYKKYGSRMPLILTGSQKEGQKSILKRIDDFNLKESVKFLGFIPTADMPALYRLSSGLVFPSLFEGFGMPVLEAMVSGCPVACSNVTSLPEIVGDTAETFDPMDAEAIADAMYRLIHDEELRNGNIQRALERTRMFSWEKTAVQTIQVYRETYKAMGVSC